MLIAIIITVVITVLVCCVIFLAKRNQIQSKPEPPQFHHPYYPPQEPVKYIPPSEPGAEYGKPITKAQQRMIDAQMKRFLEEHPNFSFWKDHPEYMEKYLNDIDLSELDLNK